MSTHTQFPLDWEQIEIRSDPEDVAKLYLEYLNARRADSGLSGIDGGVPQYHFEKPPRGGSWEKDGSMGWQVLHNGMPPYAQRF